MKRAKTIAVAVLLALAIGWGFVWPLGLMYWNLRQGHQARAVLLAAMRSRFPELEVQGGYSYRSPSVALLVWAANPRQREEVEAWVADQKRQLTPHVEVRIEFME